MKRKKTIRTLALTLSVLSLYITASIPSNSILESIGVIQEVQAATSGIYITSLSRTASTGVYNLYMSNGEAYHTTASATVNGIPYLLFSEGIGVIEPGAWGSKASVTDNSSSITIPEKISVSGVDYRIQGIGSYSFYNTKTVKSIILPDSISYIGNAAFRSCTNLESINMGRNIRAIDESLFSECSSLKSITVAASVQTIGNSAFERCSNLESVKFEDRTEPLKISLYNVFYNCSKLTDIIFPNGTIFDRGTVSNPSNTFKYCTKLESVDLSGSILTEIPNSMFEGATALKSLKLPNTIQSIGASAFYGIGVEFLNFDYNISNISNSAFGSVIVKSTKNNIDKITSRPRVYFYDSDGVECLASFSVPNNTNIASYASQIGTKWDRVSGSILGNIVEDSTFTLSGDLVIPVEPKLENPVLTTSKNRAENRESDVTISVK